MSENSIIPTPYSLRIVGIPPSVAASVIKAFCDQLGQVIQFHLVNPKSSGKPRIVNTYVVSTLSLASMRAKLEEQPLIIQEIKLSSPHPQPNPKILILKHLPKNVDAEGIRNMIKPATPSSISDANSELSNEQKKVCFVSFQTKEEAFAAFQKRGSWRYNGLVPDVWFAPERRPQHNQSETPSAVSQPPTNREARAFPKMGNPTSDSFEVKIVGLPSSTTEAILASALKDVSIVSLRVLYQLKASGKYAFVAVKTKHDQEALIAMQDTLTIDGHKLTIFQPSDTDLRLEQLPQGTTKEELVSLFPNSKVVRVNLFGQKGKIKADVIFANSASLKEALKRTENLELRSHRVQVNRVYHDLVRQEEHRFNFRPANPQEIPKTTSEPAPTPLSDSTVLSPSRYIATANFVEIEGFPGAVEMAHGQIVTIIKQDARGWSYVMIEATGKEGFVPTSYLEQYVPYSPSVFDQLPPPPPPPTQPVQNIAPSPHMPQNWLNPVPSYSQQPYPNMSSQNTIIPSNMIPAAHSYQNYLPAPVPPNAQFGMQSGSMSAAAVPSNRPSTLSQHSQNRWTFDAPPPVSSVASCSPHQPSSPTTLFQTSPPSHNTTASISSHSDSSAVFAPHYPIPTQTQCQPQSQILYCGISGNPIRTIARLRTDPEEVYEFEELRKFVEENGICPKTFETVLVSDIIVQ